jgi:hypothetical protein
VDGMDVVDDMDSVDERMGVGAFLRQIFREKLDGSFRNLRSNLYWNH